LQYWWVNQNQTHREEIAGGFMWSPKARRDGASHHFYDNMTRVAPGDLVFSYFDGQISHAGIIQSKARTAMKPAFRSPEASWSSEGWRVDVRYFRLPSAFRPRDHLSGIGPLLPDRYAPLRQNGDGKQNVYLAYLPVELGLMLMNLGGITQNEAITVAERYLMETAAVDNVEVELRESTGLLETEKQAVIKARIGQGRFREDVLRFHRSCPFTGVVEPIFLRASHIKPWARCHDDSERLDPYNGLALSPAADHLFDKGMVTFSSKGHASFHPGIGLDQLKLIGIDPDNEYRLRTLSGAQQEYLDYHRNYVYGRFLDIAER